MSNYLYKAVRPNGTDFYTGTVRWASPEGEQFKPRLVLHREATDSGLRKVRERVSARYYLSVSTKAGDCTGARWPMRLLLVRPHLDYPHMEVDPETALPNKRIALGWNVVGEIEAYNIFGSRGQGVVSTMEEMVPNIQHTRQVDRLLDTLPNTDVTERASMDALMRDLGYAAAWGIVRNETWRALDWTFRDEPAEERWSLLQPLRHVLAEKMLARYGILGSTYTAWWADFMRKEAQGR